MKRWIGPAASLAKFTLGMSLIGGLALSTAALPAGADDDA
ncbi:MAG: hypothetical protein JWQ17_4691, partial [Tardiphaga sp.]|nr:hypothetical protein [Tardiphaga sp.]